MVRKEKKCIYINNNNNNSCNNNNNNNNIDNGNNSNNMLGTTEIRGEVLQCMGYNMYKNMYVQPQRVLVFQPFWS